jgi:endonuclease/exonuclease/phosphatase family metal-dependent hydrolase
MQRRAVCILVLIVLWVMPCSVGLAQDAASTIRVMSFNIRYGTANDGINRWDLRKEFLVETIESYAPDLLGTQETLESQRDYLATALIGYGVVGVGRDDGQAKGEMAALYYRKARFEEVKHGHFWLSENPDKVGSKGWDAALPRIASWVLLKDRSDPEGKEILFLNAHLDHQGREARVQSTALIRRKLQELGQGCRWIVTGDFNASPTEKPYTNLFGLKTEDSRTLSDTFRAFRPIAEPGEGTFTSFQVQNRNGERIDWIGCSEEFEVRVAGIDRTSRDGRTPSDHFPVFATLRSKSQPRESKLHVLSYNIHHGEGTDGKLALPRIAKVIRDTDPDLVALQEVDQGVKRSGNVQQAVALAEMTGYHFGFYKAIDFGGGEYGQAILSRWPISQVTGIQLPNRDGREQRIAIVVDLETELGKIRFAGTHLDHSLSELRQEQASALVEYLTKSVGEESEQLCILAGDLNDTPESETLRRFQGWKHVPRVAGQDGVLATYPSEEPKSQIDFVLLRNNDAWELESCKVIDESIASDHRPLTAVIRKKQ